MATVLLAAAYRWAGIRWLFADVLGENRSMVHILSDLALPLGIARQSSSLPIEFGPASSAVRWEHRSYDAAKHRPG